MDANRAFEPMDVLYRTVKAPLPNFKKLGQADWKPQTCINSRSGRFQRLKKVFKYSLMFFMRTSLLTLQLLSRLKLSISVAFFSSINVLRFPLWQLKEGLNLTLYYPSVLHHCVLQISHLKAFDYHQHLPLHPQCPVKPFTPTCTPTSASNSSWRSGCNLRSSFNPDVRVWWSYRVNPPRF